MTSHPRTALFGGSFDPIHLGHTSLMEHILQRDIVDEITVLPCKQSPHKTNHTKASGTQRYEMCQLACHHLTGVQISDFELTNESSSSYSWITVQHYLAQLQTKNIYWILGTDQWDALERWSKIDYLAKHVHFLVVTRQSDITPKSGITYTPIPFDFEISSTQIRAELKDQTKEVKGLSPEVLHYIKKHRLYL